MICELSCTCADFRLFQASRSQTCAERGPWKLYRDPACSRFLSSCPLFPRPWSLPAQQACPHEFYFIRISCVWEVDGHREFAWCINCSKEQDNRWLSRLWSMGYPCKLLEGPCSYTSPMSSHLSSNGGTFLCGKMPALLYNVLREEKRPPRDGKTIR